jgi:mannonate dehydratase
LATAGLATCSPPTSALFKITNPCLDLGGTPASSLETVVWQGIKAYDWWDCHTHIIGSGDGNSGITLSRDMNSPLLHPLQTLHHWAYTNAACTGSNGGQDATSVNHLLALLNTMPKGTKAMLHAFDKTYGTNGDADHAHTAFFVPNEHAKTLAQRYPERFEWVASIHPYRQDCVTVLEQAAADDARVVKWLPSAMGIDPAVAECDRFYKAATRLNIPIISHGD